MLKTLEETIELINEGKAMHIAADDSLLLKLPKGKWIGGTTPYIISEEGGMITKDRLFVNVIDYAAEGYENRVMAEVYLNIGLFYRDITMNIREGSDKGSYLPLFNNLSDLINTVAVDENESEIVRLELLELGRAALHQYVPKFKVDGVTKERILELYNVINETVTNIDTTADITTEKRQNTMNFMPDTLDRINIEYGT